ncbi:hypothetical protein BHM03_00039176 [Ensete ventricosum]|nr:hypothetical protein BHM03_00039176 [Ensete ventricosum]
MFGQVTLNVMFWSKACPLALPPNSPLRLEEPHYEGIKRVMLKLLLFYSKQSKSIRGANVVYRRIISQVDKPAIYDETAATTERGSEIKRRVRGSWEEGEADMRALIGSIEPTNRVLAASLRCCCYGRSPGLNWALAQSARRLGSGERLGDASLKRTTWSLNEVLGPHLASPKRLGSRFAILICIAWYGRYISVCRPLATRRYRQKSIVGGRLREKKGRRRRGKEEKRRRGEKEKKDIPSVVLTRRSPAHRRRPRPLFLPRGEKDRGDIAPFLFLF